MKKLLFTTKFALFAHSVMGQAFTGQYDWEQDLRFTLADSPVALTATATCGLPVSYESSDGTVAQVDGYNVNNWHVLHSKNIFMRLCLIREFYVNLQRQLMIHYDASFV